MDSKVININIGDLIEDEINITKYNNAAMRNDLVEFYHTFIKVKYCKWKLSMISIPLSIILLVMSTMLWILRYPSLYGAKSLNVFFTLSWITFAMGWALPLVAFIYKVNLVQNLKLRISSDEFNMILFLQRVCVISGVLSTGLLLLARTYVGECVDEKKDSWRFFMSAGCNPEVLVHMIPQDQAFAVVISPMFAHHILKSNKDVVFISYLISFLSLLIATVAFGMYQSLWICALSFSTFLCAYEVPTHSFIHLLTHLFLRIYSWSDRL